jgi:hypothetical protein
MNPEYTDTDLIERYLEGKLEGEELLNFENRMQQDLSFKGQVEAQKISISILEDYELLQIKKQMQREMPQLPKGGGSNTIFYGGMLVLFVTCVAGYFLFKGKESNIKNDSTKNVVVSGGNVLLQNNSSEESVVKNNADNNKNNPAVNNPLERPGQSSVLENKTNPSENPAINASSKEETTLYTAPQIVDNSKKVDSLSKENKCKTLVIENKIESDNSCENKKTGFIKINVLKGGSEPYSFKIKNSGKFISSERFDQLAAGDYHVWVKEGSGCIYEVPTIVHIGIKECVEPFNATYTPSQEPYWKLPIEAGQSCKIKFQDKAGRLVHEMSVQNGQPSEWDGINFRGELTPAGYYYVIIEMADGKVTYGYLTINR